jgi:hypothetical protein
MAGGRTREGERPGYAAMLQKELELFFSKRCIVLSLASSGRKGAFRGL